MRRSSLRRRVGLPLCVAAVFTLFCASCGEGEPAREMRPAYDASGHALRAVTRPERFPNLVIVVIDSLRRDALPLEGEAGSVARMPHLASLARRGLAFENAVAPAPWTLPSMTSLLTGLQPSSHGLHTQQSQVQLVGAITTWAEILSGAYGYETLAYTAGPWFEGSGETVLQGFTTKQVDFSLRDAERELWRWQHFRDPGRPFFLLLHTNDAHEPYGEVNHPWRGDQLPDLAGEPTLLGSQADPGEMFRRCYLDVGTGRALRKALGRPQLVGILNRYAHTGYAASPRPELAAELAGAYWAGVRWTDGLLARTTSFLGEKGLLENTLLVVASDHGEGFGEHGSLSHGRMLYDELVHVPLVMVGPEPFQGGRVVTSCVGLVDVIPTFFDWAGLEPQPGVEGRSQLALLEHDLDCRPVISEERLGFLNTGDPVDAIRISVRTEQWKYVVTYDLQTRGAHEEVYDLLIDSNEIDDLGGGSGRLPPELTFDDCFCEAVERVRLRIWTRSAVGHDDDSHLPYGTTNRSPTTPPPARCGGREQ